MKLCFQQKSEARLLALARGDLGAESDEERTTTGMGLNAPSNINGCVSIMRPQRLLVTSCDFSISLPLSPCSHWSLHQAPRRSIKNCSTEKSQVKTDG